MNMMETNRKGFASDNNAGVHPEILKAMVLANGGHTIAYGEDPYTRRAVEKFKRLLGEDTKVYFVFFLQSYVSRIFSLTSWRMRRIDSEWCE